MLLPLVLSSLDANARGLAALIELFSITGVVHLSQPLHDRPEYSIVDGVRVYASALAAPLSSVRCAAGVVARAPAFANPLFSLCLLTSAWRSCVVSPTDFVLTVVVNDSPVSRLPSFLTTPDF